MQNLAKPFAKALHTYNIIQHTHVGKFAWGERLVKASRLPSHLLHGFWLTGIDSQEMGLVKKPFGALCKLADQPLLQSENLAKSLQVLTTLKSSQEHYDTARKAIWILFRCP